MKIENFSKPLTSKVLSENLAKKFGSQLNLSRYTMEQLEDFRNKIRTKISQSEKTSGFNANLANESYQRDKLILDVINAHLSENLAESIDTKQAGVVQAALDLQNKVKNMLEDIGSMTTKTMVALSDDIKETLGSAAAEEFGAIVTPALQAAMDHLQGTRAAIESGVAILTGEGAPTTIGAEPAPMPAPEMGPEMGGEPADMDAMNTPPEEDEFAASDASAGGPEIAGRMKRESLIVRKPTLSESNRLMARLAK